MFAFFGSFEDFTKQLEFFLRNWGLCHSETNSELLGSDVARSKSIEVTEELVNANTLFFALS